MLQGEHSAIEHSAILSTFIKQPIVIKMFFFSISEWRLKTGFAETQNPILAVSSFMHMPVHIGTPLATSECSDKPAHPHNLACLHYSHIQRQIDEDSDHNLGI